MKRIIFIRHGQTVDNSTKIVQGYLSSLNIHGLEQASAATERFKDIGAEVIYTSNMIRASETAEILSKSLGLPVIKTGYLREKLRPLEQRNISHESEEFKNIEKTILENYNTDNYRYSDEENFEDLKERASQAFKLLLDEKRKTIIVVTHRNFLYYLTGYGLFGDKFSREHGQVFITKLHIDNTGLVEFVNSQNDDNGWVLHRWNDHSHLA
ncbi:MAG: histidine phosphatase family protein [Candidatus Saccharibacteria bacterium]|nr:histidine phosphatase family protein [Candidatus Saccharibacteria bacterium]